MEQKQAYEDKLKAQLDQWNAKIDLLKAKAAKAEADARVNCLETIEDLKNKRNQAREKLQELRQAGDNAWLDLKGGVEEAWNRLGDAVKSATSRFL